MISGTSQEFDEDRESGVSWSGPSLDFRVVRDGYPRKQSWPVAIVAALIGLGLGTLDSAYLGVSLGAALAFPVSLMAPMHAPRTSRLQVTSSGTTGADPFGKLLFTAPLQALLACRPKTSADPLSPQASCPAVFELDLIDRNFDVAVNPSQRAAVQELTDLAQKSSAQLRPERVTAQWQSDRATRHTTFVATMSFGLMAWVPCFAWLQPKAQFTPDFVVLTFVSLFLVRALMALVEWPADSPRVLVGRGNLHVDPSSSSKLDQAELFSAKGLSFLPNDLPTLKQLGLEFDVQLNQLRSLTVTPIGLMIHTNEGDLKVVGTVGLSNHRALTTFLTLIEQKNQATESMAIEKRDHLES